MIAVDTLRAQQLRLIDQHHRQSTDVSRQNGGRHLGGTVLDAHLTDGVQILQRLVLQITRPWQEDTHVRTCLSQGAW